MASKHRQKKKRKKESLITNFRTLTFGFNFSSLVVFIKKLSFFRVAFQFSMAIRSVFIQDQVSRAPF
jgi:hypothetical protein